jgi:ADP-heptose:LPS heptosyltransferase
MAQRPEIRTLIQVAKAPPLQRILIIQLGPLGDFVQSLAAAKLIREAHKGAHITLLTVPAFAQLADACPYFDLVETDGTPQKWNDRVTLFRRLRKAKYKRVYDLTTSELTEQYFYGFLPFAPEWSGTSTGCSHPHRNPKRMDMHPIDRQAEQMHAAGIGPTRGYPINCAPGPDTSWVFAARPRAPSMTPEFFGLDRPYVMFVPGGSQPHKRWPVDAYAELAIALGDSGFMVAVVGGTGESPLARSLASAHKRVRDLTGRTDLLQIAALGARTAFAIGNDTGPMHVVAASGAPSLVLCGGEQDPTLYAPRGKLVLTLRAHSLNDLGVEEVLRAMSAGGAFEQLQTRLNV